MNHWLPAVVLLGVALAGAVQAAPVPEPQPGNKVEFEMHNGYFVSNRSDIKDPETYLMITTPEQFTKCFGSGVTMGKRNNLLPTGAFDSKVVIAAVKKGNQIWTYKVDKVLVKDGVVNVQYEAMANPPGTAMFASPMIVSIPKGAYKTVVFVENGKEVKKVEVGK
jgi:hypothetical protein